MPLPRIHQYRRAWLAAVFVLAALCALPALTSPPLEDDVTHEVMLRNGLPGVHWTPFELYDFAGGPARSADRLRETGAIPWFASSGLRLRFFRPLSSASLAVDDWLFGGRTWPARVDSLIWFLVAVGFAAAIHRRMLAPGAAVLATTIYALASGHAVPISWIAARHTVVGTALALAACWCYARGREGWRRGRWLGPLVLIVALFSSEVALGAVAFIGAWELVGRPDALRRRLGELAPYAAIAAAYLAFYAGAGYGAHEIAAYLNPAPNLSTLGVMTSRLGTLIGEMVTSVPADLVGARRLEVQVASAILGVSAALVAWGVLRFARRSVPPIEAGTVRWGTLAAVAAALPGTLTLAAGRTLTLALVPASAVMAIVILRGAQAVRGAPRGVARLAAAVVVGGLALGLIGGGPFFRVRTAASLAATARAQQALASTIPPCAGTMVIVNGSDPTVAHVAPALLALRGQAPRRLLVLSTSPVTLRIERVTPTGFDLRSLGTPKWPAVRVYRGDPVPAGTHVSIPGLDATVMETSGPNGGPFWEGSLVRFDFGEPLDSPDLCFLQWVRGRIERIAPPQPGDVVDLPVQFGPLGW
jgi:hypothetical protein